MKAHSGPTVNITVTLPHCCRALPDSVITDAIQSVLGDSAVIDLRHEGGEELKVFGCPRGTSFVINQKLNRAIRDFCNNKKIFSPLKAEIFITEEMGSQQATPPKPRLAGTGQRATGLTPKGKPIMRPPVRR
jgi:hypothetical protein